MPIAPVASCSTPVAQRASKNRAMIELNGRIVCLHASIGKRLRPSRRAFYTTFVIRLGEAQVVARLRSELRTLGAPVSAGAIRRCFDRFICGRPDEGLALAGRPPTAAHPLAVVVAAQRVPRLKLPP